MEFSDAEFHLRVPLIVRVKVGQRWGDMKPWNETQDARSGDDKQA